MRHIGVLFGVALLGISGSVLLGLQAAEAPERDTAPNGKGIGTIQHPPMPDNASPSGQAKGGGGGGGRPGGGGGKKTTSNGIDYHGGPVMTSPVDQYYIWYGDWSNNNAQTIIDDFAANIIASPYYNINTTYYDSTNLHVSRQGGVVKDLPISAIASTNYPYGTSLSDTDIQNIVLDAINAKGGLGINENAIYFVLTSADVTETSGFCTLYCGWHTYMTIKAGGNSVIKYAFIGNPDQCPTACSAQAISPNGNLGADAMASIIAHELEEAAADPQLNAWYDHRGYENADKCAWTFGTVYTTPNGAYANMQLGGRDFLIQQNWVNASGGYCAISYK